MEFVVGVIGGFTFYSEHGDDDFVFHCCLFFFIKSKILHSNSFFGLQELEF